MKKFTSLMIIFSLLFCLLPSFNAAKAEELPTLQLNEIEQDKLSGVSPNNGSVTVKVDNTVIGEKNVLANEPFTVTFSKDIVGGNDLSVTFTGPEGSTSTSHVKFDPANVNTPNNKDRIIKGTAPAGADVTAFVGTEGLTLSNHNRETGAFEFAASDLLAIGTEVKIISTINNIKSTTYTVVKADAPPSKPKVKSISNKDTYISGSADPNTIVYAIVDKTKTYKVVMGNSNTFKIQLQDSKPLKAGSIVTIYAVDEKNRKSGTLTLKVADKVPPSTPKVGKVTNKSFTITGTTSASAKVYLVKNKKSYKSGKASSSGKFTFRIPLHSTSNTFEVYAKDAAGNKSKTAVVKVYSKSRYSKKVITAPLVRQMPELPRGCEVTSLSMLLGDAGVNVSKMTLASKVKKDTTPYKKKNGRIYFGNPNTGFVGNMYTFSKPGFGVFNKPIEQLAEKYLPNRIINLTGSSFDTVLNYVSAGHPVWVINTSWFSHVPSSYWQTWYTPTGKVRITMKEHSVLVTGYDSKYVYFNDPLDGKKNKKKPLKSFIEGWKQYGSQAISYF